MKIKDSRYHGSQAEVVDVISYPSEEQEFTFTAFRNDETISIYTSDSTMLTKLLKVVPHDEVTILSVSNTGFITSMKCELSKKQLSLRKNSSKDKL